jgi:dTDP-4-dehydrorhamnose reductase
MRILILGGSGMLGFQMILECLKKDIDVHVALRNPSKLPTLIREKIDNRMYVLEDAGNWTLLEKCVSEIQPDYVINCVGIVKQSSLAKNHIESITINSLLPHKLEHFGNMYGFKLIHISTDCVFSGKKGFYTEEDFTDTDDLYGRSKLLGEVDHGCGITLRTSIIGHEIVSPTFGLLEWFLSASGSVDGYHSAIFSGLTTNELSKVILEKVIPLDLSPQVLQIASDPINKFDLLNLIGDVYGKKINIEPSDRVRIDRSLNGSKFTELTGYVAPSWRSMIETMRMERI